MKHWPMEELVLTLLGYVLLSSFKNLNIPLQLSITGWIINWKHACIGIENWSRGCYILASWKLKTNNPLRMAEQSKSALPDRTCKGNTHGPCPEDCLVGGGSTGYNHRDFRLFCLVEHFRGYSSGSKENALWKIEIIKQGFTNNFIQGIVPADIVDDYMWQLAFCGKGDSVDTPCFLI